MQFEDRRRRECASARKQALDSIKPSYVPLVTGAAKYHIGRSKAFMYARQGLLETFRLGRETMVTVKSLEELPSKLGLLPASTDGAAQ